MSDPFIHCIYDQMRMFPLYAHVLYYKYICNSPRTAAFYFSGSRTDHGKPHFTPKAPSSQHQCLPGYSQNPFLKQGSQHLNHLYPLDRYVFPIIQAELHSHFAQPNPSRGFAALAGSTPPFASFNKSRSPSKKSRSIRSANFEVPCFIIAYQIQHAACHLRCCCSRACLAARRPHAIRTPSKPTSTSPPSSSI